MLYGQSHSWIQVHFFIISCVIQLSFLLDVQPLKSKVDVANEVINELFLIAIGYHMVLLTGYVVQPQQKLEIGKILLQLVWVMLGFNALMIFIGVRNGIFSIKDRMKKQIHISKELAKAKRLRNS